MPQLSIGLRSSRLRPDSDSLAKVQARLAREIVEPRRPIVVLMHLVLVVLASYLAFWLRFDGNIEATEMRLWMHMLPWLVAIRSIVFVPFRLYSGTWRYTDILDLRNILAAVASSTMLFVLVVRWGLESTSYPRSIYVIDAIVLVFLLGAIRMAHRIWRELPIGKREAAETVGRRVLVFGAGDAGAMIVRDMNHHRIGEYTPIGFVDDDPTKVGQWIHGVQVLGTRDDLVSIIESSKPDDVLVALPEADSPTMRGIVRALEPFNASIMTVAGNESHDGKIVSTQIRRLAVEDLLPRAQVALQVQSARHLIADRRLLVTGAGGSIGSELCRQISALHPQLLVLYERYENSLYTIANDLADRGAAEHIVPVVGDVTDAKRIVAIMTEYRPHIVFHAAAHKHVPLMELNACEAVKNNVLGTQTVARAADQCGVQRMILISTDKAVNPTSVMGTTKRIAEMIVRAAATESATAFATVRFGNVLGSNGSVVPRLMDQIKAGGPVTVTHPEIRRYFMLIPEAVQLVLQAAALARGGEIFVLEMGDQIKVLDLARSLIRLAGLVPDHDIKIRFVGLRPGEKLSEELTGSDETVRPSAAAHILEVSSTSLPDRPLLASQVSELVHLATQGRAQAVIHQLRRIVPSFRPGTECLQTAPPVLLPSILRDARSQRPASRRVIPS